MAKFYLTKVFLGGLHIGNIVIQQTNADMCSGYLTEIRRGFKNRQFVWWNSEPAGIDGPP